MWAGFVQFLRDVAPLIELFTLVLWGVYVFFTIRTFKEVQRQTELQSEAFLLLSAEITSTISDKTLNRESIESRELYEKWKGIINTNLPNTIGQPSWLMLKLRNKGRSDVVNWKITITAKVFPSQYLRDNVNVVGDIKEWTIASGSSKEIIQSNECIELLVCSTNVYPAAVFSWNVEFEDMRGRKYTSISGDHSSDIRNGLIDSFKK